MKIPEHLRLRRGGGNAPHKPILLLALLHLFDDGLVYENRFEISADWINLFKGYWKSLAPDDQFRDRFFLPYYHLSNEHSCIWGLYKLPGWEHAMTGSRSPKSLGALLAFMPWGQLREDVFLRWLDEDNRMVDRAILMKAYFPDKQLPEILPDQIKVIEEQIEKDDPTTYRKRQLNQLADEEEEEQVLRSAAFKRKIPQLYDHRCAMTGLRVTQKGRMQLIDACHIVPWADSFDDTISNGISLSPTLHRAFDRGLISIASDYRLLVADDLVEAGSEHSIRLLANRRLFLPADPRHFPAQENLRHHRERFGFA